MSETFVPCIRCGAPAVCTLVITIPVHRPDEKTECPPLYAVLGEACVHHRDTTTIKHIDLGDLLFGLCKLPLSVTVIDEGVCIEAKPLGWKPVDTHVKVAEDLHEERLRAQAKHQNN